MLSDWWHWAPGDVRGSTNYATLDSLKTLWIRLGWDDGHKNFVTVPPSSIFPVLFPLTYFIVVVVVVVFCSGLLLLCCCCFICFVSHLFTYAIDSHYSTFHLWFFQFLRFVFALGLLSCVCITQELICVYIWSLLSPYFSLLFVVVVVVTASAVTVSVVAIGSAHDGPHKVSWQYQCHNSH